MEDHLLGSYMAAAVAVVQAQFTARRFPDGMQVRRRSYGCEINSV